MHAEGCFGVTQHRLSNPFYAHPISGQLALAWVLGQGEDVVPVPGTRRTRYLEENLSSAAIKLTPDQMRKLSRITDPTNVYGERYDEAVMKVRGRWRIVVQFWFFLRGKGSFVRHTSFTHYFSLGNVAAFQFKSAAASCAHLVLHISSPP